MNGYSRVNILIQEDQSGISGTMTLIYWNEERKTISNVFNEIKYTKKQLQNNLSETKSDSEI